jgi:uncharacterized protein YegJ (DUF2314 family)
VKRALAPTSAGLILAALTLAVAPAALAQDAADGAFVREKALSPDEEAALNKAFGDAVQAARASLPVFWGRLAENPAPSPDDFQLKVVFKTADGGFEDLWLSDIKRDGARISGRLNYEPESLPNMHRSQIVPIPEGNIVDWTFKEGRKRYGHFTTRVIAKAHPEEAAKTLAALSDNPLPADARK